MHQDYKGQMCRGALWLTAYKHIHPLNRNFYLQLRKTWNADLKKKKTTFTYPNTEKIIT